MHLSILISIILLEYCETLWLPPYNPLCYNKRWFLVCDSNEKVFYSIFNYFKSLLLNGSFT